MVFAIVHEGQRALLAVCIVFTILPITSFVLRVVSRRMSAQPLGSSDWTIFVGVLFAIAVVIGNLVCLLAGGMGEYEYKVSQAQLLVFQQALLAVQLCWAVSLGFTKSSMCLLYMQLFSFKRFRIAAYLVMALCIGFAIMVFSATLAICEPFEKNLVPSTPGSCGNRNAFWLCVGILNIFTDLTVLALPAPLIWRLKVRVSQKIYLSIMFSLGFFVIAVSAIRLSYLLNVDFEGDLTYSVINTNIWSLLEPTLAATVGSLPTMGPLIRVARNGIYRLSGRTINEDSTPSPSINTFHRRERERDPRRDQFSKLEADGDQSEQGVMTTITPGPPRVAHNGVYSGGSSTRAMLDGSDHAPSIDGVHVTTEIELHTTSAI